MGRLKLDGTERKKINKLSERQRDWLRKEIAVIVAEKKIPQDMSFDSVVISKLNQKIDENETLREYLFEKGKQVEKSHIAKLRKDMGIVLRGAGNGKVSRQSASSDQKGLAISLGRIHAKIARIEERIEKIDVVDKKMDDLLQLLVNAGVIKVPASS